MPAAVSGAFPGSPPCPMVNVYQISSAASSMGTKLIWDFVLLQHRQNIGKVRAVITDADAQMDFLYTDTLQCLHFLNHTSIIRLCVHSTWQSYLIVGQSACPTILYGCIIAWSLL